MKKLVFPLILCSLLLTGCNNDEDLDNEVVETSITDVEGNEYGVVKIGDQLWMSENLKTTHFDDGTAIAHLVDSAEWFSASSAAYCWYDNDMGYKDGNAGALYNSYAVANDQLCPAGWRIPSDTDWKILEEHIGMSTNEIDDWLYRGLDEGKKLKSMDGWANGYPGLDEYGFNAVPVGDRADWYEDSKEFGGRGVSTRFWTSSIYDYPVIRGLWKDDILRYQKIDYYTAGYSVRCIKDE